MDLFIVILSILDIVIDLAADNATGSFSPAILKVARVFRVLRMGRLLRLFKVCHLQFMLSFESVCCFFFSSYRRLKDVFMEWKFSGTFEKRAPESFNGSVIIIIVIFKMNSR